MSDVSENVFTSEQVAKLHRHQFGPFASPFDRMHPFTCPNRGDGQHFDNGSDLGALIPTVRGWICQCCDYTQGYHSGAALIADRLSLISALQIQPQSAPQAALAALATTDTGQPATAAQGADLGGEAC